MPREDTHTERPTPYHRPTYNSAYNNPTYDQTRQVRKWNRELWDIQRHPINRARRIYRYIADDTYAGTTIWLHWKHARECPNQKVHRGWVEWVNARRYPQGFSLQEVLEEWGHEHRMVKYTPPIAQITTRPLLLHLVELVRLIEGMPARYHHATLADIGAIHAWVLNKWTESGEMDNEAWKRMEETVEDIWMSLD
jgi:hypothetical protein